MEPEERDRDQHEGDFAEGVEDREQHPEDEKKGDFAEGIEAED
jgi:hypothetical protein